MHTYNGDYLGPSHDGHIHLFAISKLQRIGQRNAQASGRVQRPLAQQKLEDRQEISQCICDDRILLCDLRWISCSGIMEPGRNNELHIRIRQLDPHGSLRFCRDVYHHSSR